MRQSIRAIVYVRNISYLGIIFHIMLDSVKNPIIFGTSKDLTVAGLRTKNLIL